MRNQTTTTGHAAKPTTVVVVDDHHVIRSALSMLLGSAPDLTVVGEAASVDQACQVIEVQRPDVVLLDLHLQDEDGLDVARRLRERDTRTKILVLSASEEIHNLRAALDAGADGFLNKSADPQGLVDSVRRTAGGERVIGQEFLYNLAGRADAPAASPRRSWLRRSPGPPSARRPSR